LSDHEAPRLAPVPKEGWSDEFRAALAAGFGSEAAARLCSDDPDTPRMPNVLATLAHHPALAGPWLAYNNVLLGTPSLDPRLRELMVLRVAWRTRSRYEWVQHVRIAGRLGITGEEIDAIAGLATTAEWSGLEAGLLAATDQLLDHYRIDDATWSCLAEHLDERQLVEVVFVAGTYTCLAMAFRTLGIALDPELADVPAPPMPGGPG
jgi:4-carboxymuconolactone decarboxylase